MRRPVLTILLLLALVPLATAEPALDRALVARPFSAGSPVYDLVLAEGGELVVGACSGSAPVWEAASGRRVGELPGSGFYSTLTLADGQLITAEDLPPRVRSWDLSERRLLAELELDPSHVPLGVMGSGIPPEPGVILAPAPAGGLLAVAWKHEVRLLRARDLSLVRLLRLPPRQEGELDEGWRFLHRLSWTDDGRSLRAWGPQLTHGWSWDVARSPVAASLPPNDPTARGEEWASARATLSDGGALELRGGRDGEGGYHYRLVRLDAADEVRWSTAVPYRDVTLRHTLLALEATGQALLTARGGSPLRFSLRDGSAWRGDGPRGLRRLFSGPSEHLILWDDRNGLWLWGGVGASDPHRLATPLPEGDSPGELAALLDVDPTQRYATAELEDGRVLLWELRSGRLLRSWRDGDRPNLTGLAVRAVDGLPRCFYNAFHGDGRRITAGGRTMVDYSRGVDLVARDADDRTHLQRPPERGTRFLVGPAGRSLLTADDHLLLDLTTGLEREVPHEHRFVSGRAISPDGRRVAVAGIRDQLQLLTVYEVDEGRTLREVLRHELSGVTQDVAFDPGGERVVAVDRLGAVVLDLALEVRTRLELPDCSAARFLPDGRVAVGSRDGGVTVWDLGP